MKDLQHFKGEQINIVESNKGINTNNGIIDNRKQTIINKPPVSQIKYTQPL